MKRPLFFRLAMALPVVLMMSLSATPAKASGVLDLRQRIAFGLYTQDPTTHLFLTLYALNGGLIFDFLGLGGFHPQLPVSTGGNWGQFLSHPGMTALPGVQPGGTLTPIGGGSAGAGQPAGDSLKNILSAINHQDQNDLVIVVSPQILDAE